MPGICHRCGERVFSAEERRALNSCWHLACFSCAACGLNLDSLRLEENRQLDDIYCNACYKRLFATVSYGQSRQSFLAVRKDCNCCGDFSARNSAHKVTSSDFAFHHVNQHFKQR